jgi:hypothetical protein
MYVAYFRRTRGSEMMCKERSQAQVGRKRPTESAVSYVLKRLKCDNSWGNGGGLKMSADIRRPVAAHKMASQLCIGRTKLI